MSSTLINISTKIDPGLQEFFTALDAVASDAGAAYFVVGATARDMILTLGFGIAARRLTEDIDIGVHVEDWDVFNDLKNRLVATGSFAETGAPQRLRYQGRIPVDLVPFGDIEESVNIIAWPPDQAIQMNVIGFQDAIRASCPVRLRENPVLDVPFATLAGLALLKIAAWPDRAEVNGKDASDLAFIMREYLNAGNNSRLHEEHSDLLTEDFDYEVASARLLGRDIAVIASTATREHLLEILHAETGEQQQYRMVEAMVKVMSGSDFDQHLQLLESLQTGISDQS